MRDQSLVRLYRGITRRHNPARRPAPRTGGGTDFTDCPLTALDYAPGRSGCLLVVEVPAEHQLRVTEELWMVRDAKRFMVWGEFGDYIAAQIPAKDLRRELRFPGASQYARCDKRRMLEKSIALRLRARGPAALDHELDPRV